MRIISWLSHHYYTTVPNISFNCSSLFQIVINVLEECEAAQSYKNNANQENKVGGGLFSDKNAFKIVKHQEFNANATLYIITFTATHFLSHLSLI